MMPHKFAQIAFTPTVRQLQTEHNSRSAYARMDEREDFNSELSEREIAFIQQRDSFYMASVSETGWPYVQHRGGPKGFLKSLGSNTLGFSDFRGNKQYISTGNFRNNDRVSLFLMDYPNRTRLKILGRIHEIKGEDWEVLAKLEDDDYRATIERGFLIHVDAFDWNCPQHITPRYTQGDIEKAISAITAENTALKQELEKLRSEIGAKS
jgi:predicted pyridoxine 5'-phosphate oxidase superfamily flavin-nucleotide-binding protein